MTRIALTAGVLAVWALGVFGMWRGWRGRVARTALPALPAVPEVPGADVIEPLVGVYLGTTYAGAWLERVAAARLGERSTGWLRVLPTGVLIRRPSYDDLFVPAAAVESSRTDTAHAGKVIAGDGLLVVRWRHGESTLETGFRGDDRSRHAAVAATITQTMVDDTTRSVKEIR
ncbi:MAG: hypothetical protein QOG49_1073 [Frankiaceae bacterium]|nr:hypothetical protein [Frankiaceae bacterium]